VAIVATFVKLVNLEREKLGERRLPSSCTAFLVMASKIISHTSFLSTVSLAFFLSHFPWSQHEDIAVEEVYCVFKATHKEHLRHQFLATTGATGLIG
jgi:hypothetical protein